MTRKTTPKVLELPVCLTVEELIALTGRRRPSAQRRALRYMAIDHKQRPDGSLVVLRTALDLISRRAQTESQRTQPNWN